jgi:hypothetical protein
MEKMREFINIVKSLSYVRLKLLCNSNNRTTKRRKKNVDFLPKGSSSAA